MKKLSLLVFGLISLITTPVVAHDGHAGLPHHSHAGETSLIIAVLILLVACLSYYFYKKK